MAMKLQRTCGVLALVGPQVDEIARAYSLHLPVGDASFTTTQLPCHITLFSKAELQELSVEKVSGLQPNTRQVLPVGLGGNLDARVYFVVIVWAAGQQLRKQLGFPPKHFHLTLSSQDVHDVDKGISSLLPGEFPRDPSPDLLDHLAFTLHEFRDFQRALPVCIDLIRALPDSERGFLRLGNCALQTGHHKLSMLSYACAFQRTSHIRTRQYCIKKIIECSESTEWGCTFLEHEMVEIPGDIAHILLIPWTNELRTLLGEASVIPTMPLESRERSYIPPLLTSASKEVSFIKLPRFFRWLIPFHIALMSTPRNESDITTLSSPHLGIRHILTLTEETPLDKSWFMSKGIRNTHLPIPNYRPPSVEQMDLIIRLLEEEQNVPMLIHCGGGKGRAGTVAACYVAAYGFRKPQTGLTHPTMSANEAVAAIRALRPGSIETSQQEAFVSKWCSTIWKRQSVIPTRIPEPSPCALEIKGVLDPESDLLMLIGLPGSGKSWFANSLLARNPKGWTYISQDETRSRSSCESTIGRARGRVLLDRCNAAPEDRKAWLKLASSSVAPVAIWFDYDRDLCTSRAQNRTDHPTLPPGNRVRRAIDQMHKVFVAPSLREGFKAVIIVRSFAASQDLVGRLSPALTLFKYPRTSHLLDLGAATLDDIVDSSVPVEAHVPVLITEKVDGANIGFSLTADRLQILVQNRSHYVNPSTHEQFKKLGMWMDRHGQGLRQVLDRDEHFAERYILFGEWLSATHSIHYTRLPDRFLAFDLYDRSTGTWADRATLTSLLAPTGIHAVPLLYEGSMPTPAELMNMVQLQSRFYDGRVEGVFVKVERNGKVVARGKVVRGDFIAGNQHWTKGNLRMNGVENEKAGSRS